MDPVTVSIGLGILGAAGGWFTNRQNRDISREQMNFQERMSSTAAQRAVQDYRAAGLNPGLAYDRTASSPGGASMTMGDPITQGISTAQRAREMIQQLQTQRIQNEIAQEQSKADLAVKKTMEYKNLQDADLSFEQKMEMQRLRNFNKKLEPQDERIRSANALLQEYLIPGAKNTAAFEELLGRARPGLASAKTFTEILKMLRSNK